MTFKQAVLKEVTDMLAGEILASAPYNVSAYDIFEDGLAMGRFVKFDAGSADALDGSATPDIIGVAKRKVSGEIAEEGVYTAVGIEHDSVAEIADFGYVTVSITDAAVPTKRAPVFVINASGADSGKATQDTGETGALALADAVFWEPKSAGVWLVRINKYL